MELIKYKAIIIIINTTNGNFHSCTVHLDAIKVILYQLIRNRVALKEY